MAPYTPSAVISTFGTRALAGLLILSSRLGAQPTGGAPFPRPVGRYEVVVERSVMVPMRDGVRLATDIYRPRDVTTPLPTIVMRTPYNKAGSAGAGNYFASHGYVVAVQDVRGKFASEGEYRIYNGDMTDWTDAFDQSSHSVNKSIRAPRMRIDDDVRLGRVYRFKGLTQAIDFSHDSRDRPTVDERPHSSAYDDFVVNQQHMDERRRMLRCLCFKYHAVPWRFSSLCPD